MPLTDTKCRTAKPREKTYKLTDGNGLYLEVRPNGAKAWRYRFELDSGAGRKENVFAMGDYAAPVTGETPEQAQERRDGRRYTLAEARTERQKARALVIQGINPTQQRESHGGRHETLCAFRLMWLTLCRPNEAIEAAWRNSISTRLAGRFPQPA